MKNKIKKIPKSLIIKVGLCVVGIAVAFFAIRFFTIKNFAEGTYYGSTDISELTVDEAVPLAEKEIDKILSKTVITVKFAKDTDDSDEETVPIDGKNLSYTSPDLKESLKTAVKSKDAQKLTPKFSVSTDKIEGKLKAAADRFKSEPKDAKITGYDQTSKELILDHDALQNK